MPIDQLLPGLLGLLLSLSVAVWFARLGFSAVNARSWPTVQGRIIFSVAERRRRGARARIRYEYQVGAQRLTSDTLFFGDFMEGNAALVGERVNAYPTGREVTVRHHPQKPAISCVEPRADLRVWLFLGGTLVMAAVILDSLSRAG